jgi:hypothetical protein
VPNPDATGTVRAQDESMRRMRNSRAAHEAASIGATAKVPVHRPSQPSVTPTMSPLMLDFLAWVAARPRSYADAMEAWRSNCPRFTIWEDALGDGLIRLARGDGTAIGEVRVVLTPRGCAALTDL